MKYHPLHSYPLNTHHQTQYTNIHPNPPNYQAEPSFTYLNIQFIPSITTPLPHHNITHTPFLSPFNPDQNPITIPYLPSPIPPILNSTNTQCFL